MKYMTFNSSCSYAGLANMLSLHDIDTTDRQIALEMGLPYFFAYEDGAYLAGPSLQTTRWFDLYLNPRGFTLMETPLAKAQVPKYLRRQHCAMLGLFVENAGKHAVVYTGTEGDRFCFLNNKWEQEPSPDTLLLTEAELLSRLDDICVVATLRTISAHPGPIQKRMQESLTVLEDYRRVLLAICAQSHPTTELRNLLNPMFRALLLDGITMMDLLGNTELQTKLTALQRCLLTALRSEESEICLADHLPIDALEGAITDYRSLILFQLQN